MNIYFSGYMRASEYMYIQWIVSTKKSLSISWTITTCLTWQNQTSPFFLLFIFTTSDFPRPAAVPNNFVNFTSPTSLLGGSHPIFRPSTTLLNFNRTFDCCLSTDQTLVERENSQLEVLQNV